MPQPANRPAATAAVPLTTAKSAPPAAPDAGKTKAPPSQPTVVDPWPLTGEYAYMIIDRAFKANLARLTLGLSPAVLAEQTFDWLAHLAISPGKQLQLIEKGFRKSLHLGTYAAQSATNADVPPCITPLPHDRRFADATWQRWPYNLLYQSFLLTQQWWHNATTGVESESGHAGRTYQIRTRQTGERYLDPQSWQAETAVRQGSWWPEWESWLARHSTARVPPPSMAAAAKGYPARQEAPGSYVRQA
jgi:hypothetical protein